MADEVLAEKRRLAQDELPTLTEGQSSRDRLLEDAAGPSMRSTMPNLGRNCARCHETPGSTLELTPLDFKEFDRFFGKEATERQQAKAADERVREFPGLPIHEKAISVFAGLPDKAKIEIGNNNLKFETDFASSVEAVPGVHLDQSTADVLKSLKSLGLQGDRFEAQFTGEKRLPIKLDGFPGADTQLKLGNKEGKLNFDIDQDPNNPDKIGLKNIEGLSVAFNKAEFKIHKVQLETKDGKPSISIEVDNPLKMFDGKDTRQITVPLDKVAPGLNPDLVSGILKGVADFRSILKNRDFSAFLQGIPDATMKDTVGRVLSDVSAIEKDGDKITIKRNNDTIKQELGYGMSFKVEPEVSFRLGKDPHELRIHDIHGLSAELPRETKLSSFELSRPDQSGNRTMRLGSDGFLGDLELRFDSNFDLNMKPSELADAIAKSTRSGIDFSVGGAARTGIYLWGKAVSTGFDLLGY